MVRRTRRYWHFRRYRELYLTALALALLLYAQRVLGPSIPPVAGDLVAAGVVAALGLGAWLQRRRESRTVARALREVRTMLKDRINNQLQVVMAHLDPGPDSRAEDRERLQEVTRAVYEVSRVLDDLTPTAVETWRGSA